MSTYILVHGAFHGGWCYERVVPLLEANGHIAIAVDLPGHGDNKVPMADVTLDAYVDHVCAVVEAQPEPVILVGHSLGGMTITQVSERLPENIAWVVYLTAVMPANGQSRGDLAKLETESVVSSNRIPSADGLSVTLPDEIIQPTFYGECTDEDVAHAKERLVPQAVQIFQQPAETTPERFGTVKRAYIECLRDNAIKIEMQRKMIELLPCDRVLTLDTDHSPFYSMPQELADALVELA
jgi:pimeloyl-ACP methyl ester carboxylesterase